MGAQKKLHDSEFAPEVLQEIKSQDILIKANPVYAATIDYNAGSMVQELERKFQGAKRDDPLLETTKPEAWIAVEILPRILEVRSNTDVDDRLLNEALQRYLRREALPEEDGQPENETRLVRNLEPFHPVIEKLLLDLRDRGKSLRQILRLPRDAYSIRQVAKSIKPTTRREEIVFQGIKEKWTNLKIAMTMDMDKAELKPETGNYKSYREMYSNNPASFQSWKAQIKRKYFTPRSKPLHKPALSKKP